MRHVCSKCGREFDTLTAERLHECENPEKTEEFDTSNLTPEEQADLVVEQALVCFNCETKNDGCEAIHHHEQGGKIVFELEFTCSQCNARNENTATLEP